MLHCFMAPGRRVSLIVLAGLLLASLLTGLEPAPLRAGTPRFTVTVTTTPSSLAPGQTVTITATITSDTDVAALVDLEIDGPGGGRVAQQWFDNEWFRAGVARQLTIHWTVPGGAASGRYTVRGGLFHPGWSGQYQWFEGLASFEVRTGGGSAFQTSASAAPASVAPGGSVRLTATVWSAQALPMLVDIELTDPWGGKVHQRFFDNEWFAAGQTREFSTDWTAPPTTATGAYRIKIGLFQPGWSGQHLWNDQAGSLTVTASAPVVPTVPVAPPPPPPPAPGSKHFGVNLAGAEFTEHHLPGTMNTDYIYPTDVASLRSFASRGLTLVRVPVRWERLQPSAFGPLSATDVAGLRTTLDAIQAAGQHAIIDLHNYARYYNQPLQWGDGAKLADLWERLAREVGGHPAVWGYELMNEPHDLPGGADSWTALAQAAADGVRRADGRAWVLVPGYDWQSALRWADQNRSLNVHDAAGKVIYTAHLYFDGDQSGRYLNSYDGEGAYPTVGADRLRPFLGWLAERNAQGMLTEYGVPGNDSRWLTVLDTFLAALNAEPHIVGGTYWAAGPWWGSYPLSVEPQNGQERPQLGTLARYPSR